MRNLRKYIAGALFLAGTLPFSAAIGGNEFVLVGGTRAVIDGKQLILIDKNSRRTVAPVGRYDTRDGKYSIVVKGNEIVIRDHARELR